MSESFPTQLYKYRAFNQRTFDIFINKELYFASPYKFNDPFDCNLKIDNKCTEEKLEEILKYAQTLQDYFPEPKEVIKERFEERGNSIIEMMKKLIKEHFGILSLSKNCSNILMWSHYAQNHQGLCIELKYKKSFWDVNPAEVAYHESYPANLNVAEYTPYRDEDKGLLPEHARELFIPYVTTKSKDWEYEEEWRFLGKIGTLEFSPEMISSVIFGWKMPEEHKITIQKLLDNETWEHVQFKKAQPKDNKFEVEIVDC